MGWGDLIFGSEPEQTITTQDPIRDPGWLFADEFFNSYLPQFLGQTLPSYPGQLDPGLSPSMQNLIRGAQSYQTSPYPDILGQSSAVLGRYMNTPYEPYQYQSGPEQQALSRYMNPGLVSPQDLMGGGRNTFDTSFGFGSGIDLSQGRNLRTPGSPGTQRPPMGFGGPMPLGASGLRNMSGNFESRLQPTPPLGTDFDPNFGEPGPTPRARPEDGGGGPGTVPRGPDGRPNFVPPPQETLDDFQRLTFGFDELSPPGYRPISVNPSFVSWDPRNPTPSLVSGAGASMGPPRGPGPGPGPGGGDPNAIVPQGQLEWFGNWRGPNAGRGREYAVADMWRRGWDMGPDYQPPQEILDQWAAGGEPTTFGSRPTYQSEIDQRMGRTGAPTDDLRSTAVGSTSPGRSPQSTMMSSTPGASGLRGLLGGMGGGGKPSPGPLGGARAPGAQPGAMSSGGSDWASILQNASPQPLSMGGPGGSSSAAAPIYHFPQGNQPTNPTMQPRRLPSGPPPEAGGAPGIPAPPPSQGTSALDVYRGAVPVIQENMRQAISDSMATAGFTGNRFSSSAQNRAGEAGARAGQEMGSTLLNTLYDQTQQDLNRGLQATGMGLQDRQFQNQLGFQGRENFFDRQLRGSALGGQLAGIEESIARSRLNTPFDIYRYEQDRQDRYPLLAQQDFNEGRMGYLPWLGQLAGSRGQSPQPPITTTQGGGSGLIDWFAAFAPLLMGLSDERAKRDIDDLTAEDAREVIMSLKPRRFRWTSTGHIDAGVVAQEVEEVAPDMVLENPETGMKHVSVLALFGHLLAVVQDQERRLRELEG